MRRSGGVRRRRGGVPVTSDTHPVCEASPSGGSPRGIKARRLKSPPRGTIIAPRRAHSVMS